MKRRSSSTDTLVVRIMSKDASVSERVARVPPSVMFELADKIRQLESEGRKITDLSLGQPEVPAPTHVSKALQMALEKPLTSYSSPSGSLELRRLVAERYGKESGIDTSADEIIVTSGSKHALFISLLSLVDPGDEILVHEPFFPAYAEISELVEGTLCTVPVHTLDSGDFKLEVEDLISAVTPKTKVLLVNYPNNPAGWTFSRHDVERIANFCSEHRIYLLSDEIYDRIVFDKREHTHAWAFSSDSQYVVGLGSFSKTYSMIPYRLGYIVAKKNVCRDFLKAQRATVTMVNPYVQKAGVAALTGPQDFVGYRLEKYEERRNKCVALLRNRGIKVQNPEGAFYLFVKMPYSIADSFKFVLDFLEKQNVALFPGSVFGSKWASYVRMSLATEDELLYPAVESFAEAYLRLSL